MIAIFDQSWFYLLKVYFSQSQLELPPCIYQNRSREVILQLLESMHWPCWDLQPWVGKYTNKQTPSLSLLNKEGILREGEEKREIRLPSHMRSLNVHVLYYATLPSASWWRATDCKKLSLLFDPLTSLWQASLSLTQLLYKHTRTSPRVKISWLYAKKKGKKKNKTLHMQSCRKNTN